MKKVVLVLFFLALAVAGVFAQSNTAVADLRKELHAYIDAIPAQNLYALRSLLSLLAGQPSNRSELHEVLDSIPERNIDALKPLLQALTDPSYNATAGIIPLQGADDPETLTLIDKTNTPDKVNAKKGFLSIGGGALFDWSIKNYVEMSSYPMYDFKLVSLGVFAFLDAKYIELSIGPSYGIGNLKMGWFDKDISLLQLDINLLGKLPINLSNGKIIIFPLLGLSYNHVLSGISGTDAIVTPISELSQLGALVGAGLDFPLTSSFYLRGEGLLHVRLPSWATIDVFGQPGVKINLGMGPRVKLGVGYRF